MEKAVAEMTFMAKVCLVVFAMMVCCAQTSPIGCKSAADPYKAVDKIASNEYCVVVKNEALDLGRSVTQTTKARVSRSAGCNYKYVEMKKTVGQIPEVLITAVCEKDADGICKDARCTAITYKVPVLQQNVNCDVSLGVKTWSQKYVEVVVGYELN